MKKETIIECPNCKHTNITDCVEGSNIKPIKEINYICMDCLFEFGKKNEVLL